MKDLMDALYHMVADKWEHIGIYLHLPMPTLRTIMQNTSVTLTSASLGC